MGACAADPAGRPHRRGAGPRSDRRDWQRSTTRAPRHAQADRGRAYQRAPRWPARVLASRSRALPSSGCGVGLSCIAARRSRSKWRLTCADALYRATRRRVACAASPLGGHAQVTVTVAVNVHDQVHVRLVNADARAAHWTTLRGRSDDRHSTLVVQPRETSRQHVTYRETSTPTCKSGSASERARAGGYIRPFCMTVQFVSWQTVH
jgi:hypothetical protein